MSFNMMQPAMEGILGLIVEWLISLFWWFMRFPVVWLVSLPFIPITALFRRERDSVAVIRYRHFKHFY